MRAVSLFSGIGALDLAVAEVFGAHPVAFAEMDPNASKVLAARWPGVPNVGDVTAVRWEDWAGVDVLHGGPPCQPTSSSGKRLGENDERWMWPAALDALRRVRPRWVVWENPSALLGLGGGVPFGRILSEMAESGYVGAYGCLRASDVGACHQRDRLWIIAADADRGRLEVSVQLDGDPPRPAAYGGSQGRHADGRRTVVADAHCPGPQRRSVVRGGGGERGVVAWGDYAPAIARHAALVGRPAPAPVDERGRLSARFVEWMQVLPDGWVTDALPRNPALKALGNCVVPPCAVAAMRQIVARIGSMHGTVSA